MELTQFDSTLGGTEHLPYSANSLKFAASRSIEIAAMTDSILRPSKTKLIFQTLPVHMRRRVMSHNSKRLPRKLRAGHMEQLKKSGLPPPQKRPSRKYRRRPANLLQEYMRRQKLNVWLETHIWHAKRFHMIERWGYKLAYAPCDKAFRACYRAGSAHCLLQDISYLIPVQLTGTVEDITDIFRHITNTSCGLSIHAKAFLAGNREGRIKIFHYKTYPYAFIGDVNFIWVTNKNDKQLWLFVHPSQIREIEQVLTELCTGSECDNYEKPKRVKLTNVQLKVLPGKFNRFRLTGPNSQAILVHSLKCIEHLDKIKGDKWIEKYENKDVLFHITEKYKYWENLNCISSPSQLPPSIVIGLIVRDPRLSRPCKRTKAKLTSAEEIDLELLTNIPPYSSTSPLWDESIHKIIKQNKLSNHQFIEHVTKTQLVPGEVFVEDPKLQSVPIVLIQRPGSQNSNYKRIGYGSGWDIIVPADYGLPFWLTFIMFGARSGGFRETENLAFEMGECYFSPDTASGADNDKRIEEDLREKYFRLPPSKRVNFTKLAVNTPFICPWKILLQEWTSENTIVDKLFVLRDKNIIRFLQNCIKYKTRLPNINDADNCLVPIYLHLDNGRLKKHALICMPLSDDIKSIAKLFEPHREDPNTKLRKDKRAEHRVNIKRLRRKSKKLKAKGILTKTQKRPKHEISEYVKIMRELWLPSQISNVRHSCSRQVLGFIAEGSFSFSEAHSCGVGYIAYNALDNLIRSGHNVVLVRNTTSRKYRIGRLQIIG